MSQAGARAVCGAATGYCFAAGGAHVLRIEAVLARHLRPQDPRVFMLTMATHAFCQATRSIKSSSQRLVGSCRLSTLLTTDLAPWISGVRRLSSPRFVIRPRLALPPEEFCRGTRPSHAANCRAHRNWLKPATEAVNSEAPS